MFSTQSFVPKRATVVVMDGIGVHDNQHLELSTSFS